MPTIFEPIRIVDLDIGRTQQSPTASGLRLMHLKLSQNPHANWQLIFNNQRQFPRHTMWRRAEVKGNYIVVDCPPEEIEQYHLRDLKQDVATTNERYKEFLVKQEAEAKRLADERAAEQERLEGVKARLNFD